MAWLLHYLCEKRRDFFPETWCGRQFFFPKTGFRCCAGGKSQHTHTWTWKTFTVKFWEKILILKRIWTQKIPSKNKMRNICSTFVRRIVAFPRSLTKGRESINSRFLIDVKKATLTSKLDFEALSISLSLLFEFNVHWRRDFNLVDRSAVLLFVAAHHLQIDKSQKN